VLTACISWDKKKKKRKIKERKKERMRSLKVKSGPNNYWPSSSTGAVLRTYILGGRK
jgi:hypothetical protein